ncbi:alpha-hydroxy-acid oxidizing protein [Nonomuraea sp. NPDC005650]|uniref:alpha-hydroxy-acid oxidizing protein n=1 Tax=Nonomuraea sp. NPDC005650 TaxID=3157045 RepID=UPI0033BC795C
MEVYLDGGVHHGVDVLTALALGARAVFVGRPVLLGLAAGGDHGVDVVLGQLRKELINAMHMLDVNSIDELDASYVTKKSG